MHFRLIKMELISALEFQCKTYPIRWRIEAVAINPPSNIFYLHLPSLCSSLFAFMPYLGPTSFFMWRHSDNITNMYKWFKWHWCKVAGITRRFPIRRFIPHSDHYGAGGIENPRFQFLPNENRLFNGFGRQFYAHNLIIRKFEPHINTVEERN